MTAKLTSWTDGKIGVMNQSNSKQDTRHNDVVTKLTSWTIDKIDIINQSKYDIYNFGRVTKGKFSITFIKVFITLKFKKVFEL